MAAFEDAKHFLGYRRTGPFLVPAVSTHVSSQLSGQVAIMKEFRKYGDEKKLAREKAITTSSEVAHWSSSGCRRLSLRRWAGRREAWI